MFFFRYIKWRFEDIAERFSPKFGNVFILTRKTNKERNVLREESFTPKCSSRHVKFSAARTVFPWFPSFNLSEPENDSKNVFFLEKIFQKFSLDIQNRTSISLPECFCQNSETLRQDLRNFFKILLTKRTLFPQVVPLNKQEALLRAPSNFLSQRFTKIREESEID